MIRNKGENIGESNDTLWEILEHISENQRLNREWKNQYWGSQDQIMGKAGISNKECRIVRATNNGEKGINYGN